MLLKYMKRKDLLMKKNSFKKWLKSQSVTNRKNRKNKKRTKKILLASKINHQEKVVK